MDLDSDLLYPLSSGAGGRSFTSYTGPSRLYSDRYDLDSKCTPSFKANTSTDLNTAQTTTNNATSLYRDRPSILNTSCAISASTTTATTSITNPLQMNKSTLLSGAGTTSLGYSNLLSEPSSKILATTGSSHLDKLISSSSLKDNLTANVGNNSLFTASSLNHLPSNTFATSNNPATANQSRVQSSLAGGLNTIGSGQNLLQQMFDDMRQIEDTVDSIEIPARGRCKVFMAKYGYDPFKQSPNDNPDAELAFNAGDYIMVFDDIDEDGYFIGELMDGRRGYVPSNWLDRLTGEDLFEFQATTLYKQSKDDEGSECNSYPPEFYDAIVSETINHSNFQHLLAPEDYQRMNDYVDLDDVDEVDDECLSDYERAEAEQMRRAVPPPQRLLLERQLNKSILIGWLHPQATKGTIVSYQVYVDGVLKSTVPSGDRTKALLEGVDSHIPHRISVRAIDLSGRHSNDAGCTIVIGQKVPFAPSCVKASHITSDSALISWLPCNSNFHHVVAVNSVEVQTVKPGTYKHLINGLSANTLYRVWVRAKPGNILSINEKNPKKLESLTTYVDFKTMPKSLPDPPVNVQVEAGPQRRTLLVTWLPLTLNDFGNSNGCAVTGYAVFAGHKKLADIDSPTSDHALLDLADLESLHKKSVTVRTKSGENLSQDSMPCQIPDEYLKVVGPKLNDNSHLNSTSNQQSIRHGPSSNIHHSTNQHRISDGGTHSPLRTHQFNRYNNTNDTHKHQQHHQMHLHQNHKTTSRYNITRGRHMTRSLQNLESDLESRRSSIPAIEITRETSNSDLVHPAESYSEEEFENSMRFRGVRGKTGRINQRYRTRQSHSVDSSVPQFATNTGARYQTGSLAKLRNTSPHDRDIRYFVALFDYDPSTMSPNPNAASEELAFKEGSIIKIIGDKGSDGFYRGELDNHFGYVPCNVVSEITDANLLYSIQEKNNRLMQQQGNSLQVQGGYVSQQQRQNHQQLSQDPQQQQFDQQQGSIKRMVALYDYDPQENSPNADTESEIPFKVGDIIHVIGKMDTDGFYMGEVERTKQSGLVPSNFLREEPLPPNAKLPVSIQQKLPFMGQGGAPMVVPMDPFQQQRPLNPNHQMFANAVQQQQAGAPMDMATMGGAYVTQQPQMQVNPQQQQQQMNKMNNPQMRGAIRGVLPTQNQPLLQNNSQQNINRPTTLSLGLNTNQQQQQQQQQSQQQMADWNASNRQIMGANAMQQNLVQQQQNRPQDNQMIPNMLSQPQQQMAGQYGNINLQLQNQQNTMQQQLGQTGNQQQQQGGGVLSNLLSSGKQIIGAATTPRVPNQPGQFPSMNQIGNLGGVGAGGGGVTGMNMNLNNMLDTGNYAPVNTNRGNMIQNAFNPNDPSAQASIHNSFSVTGGVGVGAGQQMQQQQQQYNQTMGLNRGPAGTGMGNHHQMGEEQGGNILNTVKNMFKL